MRLGLVGVDSSHAEDFLRHFNSEARFDDIRVTAFWSPQPSAEREAQLRAASPDVRAAPSLTALIESVDGIVVGDRHGDLHLRHALPALAAGKPVFVDKPLTCSVADAETLVDAAERAGVPLASGSALRWQEETAITKARIAYLARPLSVSAYGTWYPQNDYGGAIFYAIHTIELIQELLGTRWTELRRTPGDTPTIGCLCGGATVSMSFRPLDESGASAFGVAIRSAELTCERTIPLPDDYMLPVAERIARMLRTGAGMDRETLLAPVRMMAQVDALLRS